MRIRGGCCGRGVWPKFSAALRTGGGGRRVVGTGRGDRTLRGRDVREPAPSAGRGSGPALGTPASALETSAWGLWGSVPVGAAGIPGARPGVAAGRAPPPPLRVCFAEGKAFTTPPHFSISLCPARVVLRSQDLIPHRREAGVCGGWPLKLRSWLPGASRPGGLEVRGKREDCAGPCRGVCGKERGRERAVPGTLRPAARRPAAPQPGAPHPAPRAWQTLGPASPGVCPGSPAHVDVGRGAARSSRHWLGSRLSRAAAVTLRLGLRALEEAGGRVLNFSLTLTVE